MSKFMLVCGTEVKSLVVASCSARWFADFHKFLPQILVCFFDVKSCPCAQIRCGRQQWSSESGKIQARSYWYR